MNTRNKIVLLHYEFDNESIQEWRDSRNANLSEAQEESFRPCIESIQEDWDYILLSNKLTKWKTVITDQKYRSSFVNKFLSAKEFIEKNPQYEWISIVDSTDTVMLSSPQMKKDTIYCSVERYATDVNRYLQIRDFVLPSEYNPWTPYFDLVPEAVEYLRDKCLYEPMINLGVVCGHRDILLKLLTKLEQEVEKAPNMIEEALTMNYILRKYFYPNLNLSKLNPAKENNKEQWWFHDYKLRS